jgi:hypothetical protein
MTAMGRKPNVRCCWRWSVGTHRGTRCARVHGALFIGFTAAERHPLERENGHS